MANSVNPDETAQVSVLVCRAERVKAEISIEYNEKTKTSLFKYTEHFTTKK